MIVETEYRTRNGLRVFVERMPDGQGILPYRAFEEGRDGRASLSGSSVDDAASRFAAWRGRAD